MLSLPLFSCACRQALFVCIVWMLISMVEKDFILVVRVGGFKQNLGAKFMWNELKVLET